MHYLRIWSMLESHLDDYINFYTQILSSPSGILVGYSRPSNAYLVALEGVSEATVPTNRKLSILREIRERNTRLLSSSRKDRFSAGA